MTGFYLLPLCVITPIIGGIFAWAMGRKQEKIRDIIVLATAVLQLALTIVTVSISIKTGVTEWSYAGFIGDGILLTLSNFRSVHIILTAFAWLFAVIFSLEHFKVMENKNRFYLFLLVTLGVTTGVFLGKDLFTIFLFFEMMSLTSCMWVIQRGSKNALRGAKVYLAISVTAGMCMLVGLFLLYNATGCFDLTLMTEKGPLLYTIVGCFMIGFGAKAGMFLVHIWLPKAYTQSYASESALLSSILSKTGLYGMLVVVADIVIGYKYIGRSLLILGAMTMLVGSVLAITSMHVKRILAYSSMAQMGFMITGIGVITIVGNNEMLHEVKAAAIKGTLLQMFNHSLGKLALFLLVGSVALTTGTYFLNQIKGSGRKNPIYHICFGVIMLTLAGIPGFSGYFSKTLLHEGIVGAMELGGATRVLLQYVEWVFMISGGCTLAYLLRIYHVLFWSKGDEECGKDSLGTSVFLVIVSGIVLFMGLNGKMTQRLAEYMSDIVSPHMEAEQVAFFTMHNLTASFTSIGIGILLYVIVVRKIGMKKTEQGKEYIELMPKWLNAGEIVYSPTFFKILPTIGFFFARIADSIVDTIVVILRKTILKDATLPFELEEGNALTYKIGKLADGISYIYCKLTKKEKKIRGSYTHKVANIYDELAENNVLITRGMSFGLLLFCMGLCITLIYVLFLA